MTLVGAAAFRSVPGVLIEPLHDEFGWSHGLIGSAVSLNLMLFGLMSPFAAALMDRFGVRPVVTIALVLVAVGSGLTVFMTEPWQLILLLGAARRPGHRLDVDGLRRHHHQPLVRRPPRPGQRHPHRRQRDRPADLPAGRRVARDRPRLAYGGAARGRCAALAVIPLVLLFLRNHPADLGLRAYGATDADPGPPPHQQVGSSAGRALGRAARRRPQPTFWLLSGGFAICGMTTNGLIATHFVPAAHDHGMPATTAASLLAVVGIFDVVGTIASGWLTDKVDPRLLLVGYYVLRGVGLMTLPALMSPHVAPSMWVFIIVYGLDWVATVPPTVALCREWFGAAAGPIVFGWVFASHQIGAAVAATGAGVVRDVTGGYDPAFYAAAGLCALAGRDVVRHPPDADAGGGAGTGAVGQAEVDDHRRVVGGRARCPAPGRARRGR